MLCFSLLVPHSFAPTSTRTRTDPITQTIAAPMGKSTLAVTNKLTTLANVAITQPTAKRAGIEFTRYVAHTAGTTRY